jgi:heme-degrading monooxygenase HmoA
LQVLRDRDSIGRMIPPPLPWRQVGDVDPEREYVAFTSRFFLRSPLAAPAFLWETLQVMRQAEHSPGIVGWAVAANLPKLEFHTLSAWQDAAALRAFVASGRHAQSMPRYRESMRRDGLFVQYKARGSELPLSWPDALARQEARLAVPRHA